MKNFVFALSLLAFAGNVQAEGFGSKINQFGKYSDIYDSGCQLSTIDQTLVVTTLTGPSAIYWVMLSSPNAVAGGFVPTLDNFTYAFIESSNTSGGVSVPVARIAITSATNVTMFQFDPPLISSTPALLSLGTNTVFAAFCYQYVSTSPYTRFNEPVSFDGESVHVDNAGCVPTRSTGTAGNLISTSPGSGFAPASSVSGTLVYWVQNSSAAPAGSGLYLRSTNTANITSAYAVPPILFNQPVSVTTQPVFNSGFDGKYFKFKPPFYVPNRISYNLGVAMFQGVTLCT